MYLFNRSKKNDVSLDKINNKIIILSNGKKTEFDVRTANILFIVKDTNNYQHGMVFHCYTNNEIDNQVKCIFKNKKDISRIRALEKEIKEYKEYLLKNDKKEHDERFQKSFEDTLVTITHPNGKVEKVSDKLILDLDDYVLISEDGKTYHKCTGCYKRWSNVYKEKFNGWKLISIEEAKHQGLKLCSFCEEAIAMDLEDILNENNVE